MNIIDVNVVGLLPLKRQFELLAMPPQRRRRLLHRVAKKVTQQSKKRIRAQKDLKGRPFEKRFKKRKKNRKMLAGLAKEIKTVRNNDQFAEVGFYKKSSARIAYQQQHGETQQNSASGFKKSSGAAYEKPATRKQAKALREAGFTIKKARGKGSKKPSLAWVVENMTMGQAGFALRRLREWSGEKSKTSWVTRLPARSFLGMTRSEVGREIEIIYLDMKAEMKRGVR